MILFKDIRLNYGNHAVIFAKNPSNFFYLYLGM